MSDHPPLLVLGTHNIKKRDELSELVSPHGIQVATLSDFPDAKEIVEDGDTFSANARLKAVGQATGLGQWVLADDSGIEVDALDGAPGIYSARFAGEPADDEANNRLLLERLTGVPTKSRGARYVCCVVLADPSGAVRAEAEAYCHGRILESPRGSGGFGYDPLFEIREYHRTFAEMGPAVKRALSHRSRAMRAVLPEIQNCIASR